MTARVLLGLAGLAVLVAAVRWAVGLHHSQRDVLAELAAHRTQHDGAPADLDAWLRHRRSSDRRTVQLHRRPRP